MEKVCEMILEQISGVVSSQQFTSLLKKHESSLRDGDLVLINNSFVYRKKLVKTKKSNKFLCLKTSNGKVLADIDHVFIAQPEDFDSDFKIFDSRSSNIPRHTPLPDALPDETARLGHLVFVLIGRLEDIACSVPLNNGYAKDVVFNPSAEPGVTEQNGRRIIVNQIIDPEKAWADVSSSITGDTECNSEALQTAFFVAFEKLRQEARLRLTLPEPGLAPSNDTLIAKIRESIEGHIQAYENALQKCYDSELNNEDYLREVMRIAYNFADDSLKILRLLVSVADIKPIVLWCTLKEHFELAVSLRDLPRMKGQEKPSLENYMEMISNSRNRTFHSLLPFDRTIEANLEDINIRARRLTLFPPYGQRKNFVHFDYEDREIIEVLSEFTRPKESVVSLDFWKKNTQVMHSLKKLLESTERALWALNKIRRA